jgi:hypothetical protein
MGMMSGRIIVGGGGGSGGIPGWVWIVVMVAAVAGAVWLAAGLRRRPRLATGGAPVCSPSAPQGTKPRVRSAKVLDPPSRAKKQGARR